jgi:translation initiation factor IF-2
MRIYEFSKKSGLANKDLIELLQKAGFPASSHMSVLSDQALAFLEKKLASPPVSEKIKPIEKPITVRQPVKEKRIEHILEQRSFVSPQKVAPAPVTQLVMQAMTVEEVAQRTGRSVGEIIVVLLKKGIVAPKNQLLNERTVADLARSLGLEVVMPEKKEKEFVGKKTTTSHGELVERMPVIVVMGHVDHGKTTLLDFIRKTRVAAKEKGGITQHLGAYRVNTAHGGIVFLDTPGHEAFSQIRVRGSRVADIAVLVVAADDSVKPQTIEALNHARAAGIPIIVAVNKIDKVDPQRIDVVKRDLMQYDLVPEEWGGQAIFVPISAKNGTGVDQLLEIIALQAQIMELKTSISAPCKGVILESKLERGRGPVATIICHEGILRNGDFFICGVTQGKVTSIVDSSGQRVAQAEPSMPVQIAGFEELATVGDTFEVVNQEAYKKARAAKGERRILIPKPSGEESVVNIIVKADSNSSKEALLTTLHELSNKAAKGEKKLYVIQAGVGDVTESDVLLAANTGSLIIALHSRIEPNAALLVQRHGVDVQMFDIIYESLEFLKKMLAGTKEIKLVKQKIGEAVVRKIFTIKGVGVIAGCYVREGRLTRDGSVIVWRGREKVGEGNIRSLQRDKRTVKEVHTGFECAFLVDSFNEWREDDRIECFAEVPQTGKGS